MNALKPLLGLLLVLSLSACGGGASSERAGLPASGVYASAQYTDAQLKPYLDQVYSTRPNEGGLQYTSANNKPAELGSQTLSLQLDLWVPPNAVTAAPQPLVVWIHGGGFFQGGKEENRDKALSYARAGYVSATINYRLTDGNELSRAARIKAQTQAAEDVANAIRFLRQNAAKYHIDPNRVATLGGSAGGALSLINAVDADTLSGTRSDYPGQTAHAQGAVSTGATLIDVYNTSSLLSFDATDSPVLLFHARPTDSVTGATWDGNVLPTQALIQNSGNACTTVAQPDQTHYVDLSLGGEYWADIYPFLRQVLNLAPLGAP